MPGNHPNRTIFTVDETNNEGSAGMCDMFNEKLNMENQDNAESEGRHDDADGDLMETFSYFCRSICYVVTTMILLPLSVISVLTGIGLLIYGAVSKENKWAVGGVITLAVGFVMLTYAACACSHMKVDIKREARQEKDEYKRLKDFQDKKLASLV